MKNKMKILAAAVMIVCTAVIGFAVLYFVRGDGKNKNGLADTKKTASKKTTQKITQKEKKKPEKKTYIVVIDPGHQRDQDTSEEPIGPGASETKPKVSSGTSGVASGLQEYELTLQVSKKLKKELKKRGYTVYMTRMTADVNISNAERAGYAKKMGADIFIRIHANGSEDHAVRGALSMAPSKKNPYAASLADKSQKLSRMVLDEYCRVTGMENRGVMLTDQMSGINWASMPVTILEMGFMSNPKDDMAMKDQQFQEKMAAGAAAGIDRYVKESGNEEDR